MATALMLSLLLQAAPATVDGIDSTFNIKTYSIHGSSSRELWDQIHHLGPLDAKEGKHFAGFTHWYVAWHYWFVRDGSGHDHDGCRLDRSTVSIDTTTTLPTWADPTDGSKALQAEWDVFAARLKEHEAGHRDNGMQAAVAIRHLIDGIGRAPDCHALGEQIDAGARAAIARANQADVDYDAKTQHGKTQGAVLP